MPLKQLNKNENDKQRHFVLWVFGVWKARANEKEVVKKPMSVHKTKLILSADSMKVVIWVPALVQIKTRREKCEWKMKDWK